MPEKIIGRLLADGHITAEEAITLLQLKTNTVTTSKDIILGPPNESTVDSFEKIIKKMVEEEEAKKQSPLVPDPYKNPFKPFPYQQPYKPFETTPPPFPYTGTATDPMIPRFVTTSTVEPKSIYNGFGLNEPIPGGIKPHENIWFKVAPDGTLEHFNKCNGDDFDNSIANQGENV